MKMQPRRQWLQAGIIGLLLVTLVYQMIPDNAVTTQKTQMLVADWFGVDVAVTDMDETGRPKRAFQAARMTHYAKQHMTDLIEPRFTLYPDTNIPWHLAAEKGRSFHGAHTTDIARIDLWHAVHVWQPYGSTDRPMEMETSTLAIFPDAQFAQTDQSVLFKQPGHRLTGEGFKAEFDTQSMELFHNVRSEHVAQTPL